MGAMRRREQAQRFHSSLTTPSARASVSLIAGICGSPGRRNSIRSSSICRCLPGLDTAARVRSTFSPASSSRRRSAVSSKLPPSISTLTVRRVFAAQPVFQPRQQPKRAAAEFRPRDAGVDLPGADAQADHGDVPQSCRRGDADDDVVAAHNGAGADEADPGENAERKAHQIVHHERARLPARGRQQEIDLDHGDGVRRQGRPTARGAKPSALPRSLRL